MTKVFITGNFLLAAALFYNYAVKGQIVDYVLGTVNVVTAGVLLWL